MCVGISIIYCSNYQCCINIYSPFYLRSCIVDCVLLCATGTSVWRMWEGTSYMYIPGTFIYVCTACKMYIEHTDHACSVHKGSLPDEGEPTQVR